MNNEDKIKTLIAQELEKEPVDYAELLSLAAQLSKEDTSSVRFSVDADHINRLGIELVARQETALAEIIKNSYDADATSVVLTFKEGTGNKQSLIVLDNGLGMSRQELIDGFMRISTSEKKHNPNSKLYGRLRAGKKGIGRFAAQRLGSKLTVITKRKEDQNYLVVTIDWDQFISDQDLITVSNVVKEHSDIDYELEDSGTVLVIEGLREQWTKAKIERSYRYASDLLAPFPVSLQKSKNETSSDESMLLPDPGFEAVFKKQNINLEPEIIVGAEDIYLDHAYAVITGKIDSEGNASWRVKSKRIDLDSGWRNYKITSYKEYLDLQSNVSESVLFNTLRNVSFTAYYFIPKTDNHVPKNLTSVINETLREHGGIRVYRNGFRVLPYGERYDDWLRLDWMVRNRVILPPIGNNNFFGTVEITPATQGEFQEVASREGLINNDSFFELKDFVASSIMSAVVEINFARKVKVFASQAGYEPTAKTEKLTDSEKEEFVKDKINQWKDQTSGASDNDESDSTSSSTDSPKTENIGINKDEFEEFAKIALELVDKSEVYRVLAGLGLAMAEFTHEVRFNLADLVLAVNNFKSELDSKGQNNLSDIETGIDRLRSFTTFFEDSFQSLANKELQVLDLRAVVNDFINTLKASSISGTGIELTASFNGYEFFTKPSHRSNIDSILVNLYSNAKKAIYRKSPSGKVNITLNESMDFIELLFSDTGDGIASDNKEKIFHPFFTTNTQNALNGSETSQMLGMGLGLSIVGEIVSGLNGEIELAEPESGFSTTFKITLPKAEDEDIPDDLF